ncbi:MAG: PD40 domain-containing protein [Cytophagales bacterium]|nr:PD40 domain-containing protein [Cytophagales bacterium]MCA6368505.1 PD40 domain-containing protein [Cytophagales bacterium]MCA6370451.1 PD40 domain-containing protein [Cytophagales bacterium]MCA6377340.1 PD40 domain-containing protein [Cytophagales bacterium]MCA6384322.1 PD40 domain-containing protein [Cytophagales bacterium]
MKKLIAVFVVGLCFLTTAFPQGTQLLRQPTLSSTQIVFVYANDLWIVSKDGGEARRLTSNEGQESNPHFSPDGKQIAFTGQYDGNTDVYLIPTEGGQPQRLTWHPGADNVTGWTPDGEAILFASARAGVPTLESKIYKINSKGGMEEALDVPRAVAGEISEDGKYLAYQQIGFWDPEWRNYRGGQAKPIWIIDLKNFSLKSTPQTDNERHTDPVWMDGVVFFLSERDYANNIWSFNPSTNELKQQTFHTDFDVKSLDAAGGQIVYEQGGYLSLLTPANSATKKIVINVRGDFHWARERWEEVKPATLTNASLSPTGQRALFEYRGEIFTAPKEKGDWRNISRNSAAADRSPVWAPNGKKIAWFSDASGEYQLMIGDQEGLEKPKAIALQNPTFFFKPTWSPDSKYISFTDTDYNLWYVDVATGQSKKADTERFAHPNRSLNPVWSPDSKWISYSRLLDNHFKAIKVHNVETGQTLQLTDGMADAISPVWDVNGKYLYFLGSTNYGLNSGWLDMSSYERPVTRALYVIVLSKSDASPIAPRSDEEKDKPKEENLPSGKAGKDTATPIVKIDMDGISNRILAIDIPLRNYTALHGGPDGYVFYTESIVNQQGLTLSRYNFKERKGEVFLSPVNDVAFSEDRKSILYRSNGTWGILGASDSNKKIGDGKLESVNSIKVKINPMEEWKQIFKEGWRYQRDFLYVSNVHGAPWNDIYKWYSPWIEHVRHRTDLNYVIDILGGEVAVGHSYTSGGDFPNIENVPVGLLGADFEKDNGLYRFKKVYLGESWNPDVKAPLREPGISISAGDYLLEVNGQAVTTSTNLYKHFEATANRQTVLKVSSKSTGEAPRTVTVIPVENENQLRSFDWIEGNRRKVDELSNGKLAYVYIPNTGNPGYTYFNRYYFSQQDKKGAIIDERNNGGGSAADYMVDIMARQLHGYFNSKASDHRPFLTPNAGIFGPKVMLINERAGSGGDLLPYLINKMKIGPLVGTKTWGGLVGTWDTPPFVDGGRMVAPRGGFYDVNGEWAVEGVGISPDIEVQQTPAEVIKGGDPQLERAVEEALKLLKTQGVEIKPEPPAPIKYKRPLKKK